MMQDGLLRAACVCVILSSGCGDSKESSAWHGEEPHIAIKGEIEGNGLDVKVDGADLEVSELSCEREYDLPVIAGQRAPEMAKLIGFEVTAIVTVNGEERAVEIDVEGPNLDKQVGKKLEVVPEGSELKDGQVVVEVKFTRQSDEAELLDDDSNDGTVTLSLLDGEPGEGGVIVPDGEGSVGLSGELRFSATDVLKVSFTAACGDNDVAELVSAP